MSSFVMMIAYVSVDSKGYFDNLSRCIMTLINYHRSNEISQRITDINRSLRLFKRKRKKSKKEQSYLQLLCQLLPLLKRFSCHFCWYFWHIFLKFNCKLWSMPLCINWNWLKFSVIFACQLLRSKNTTEFGTIAEFQSCNCSFLSVDNVSFLILPHFLALINILQTYKCWRAQQTLIMKNKKMALLNPGFLGSFIFTPYNYTTILLKHHQFWGQIFGRWK